MIDWREIPLGEACELYQPQTISTAQLVDDGPYEVFGANGVIGRYHSYNHEGPQLLVTCRGATCGTVNKSSPKAWINGNAMVVRPRSNDIDMNYLEHLLRGGIDLSIAITGAAQPQITRQSLAPIKAKFPPLPEQRRIAAILDQADTLRAKRREALAQLDGLTQSIFIEMFGDPAENPLGFPVKQLSELIATGDTINYGVVQPGDDVDEGIPLVRVGDLIGGRVQHEAIKRIEPSIESAYKRSRLVGDEILVSCVGSIGVVALATEGEKGFNIARAVARIRLSPAISRAFMAAQLGTASIQRYFTQELRTVSQPTLNIKQLAETRVIAPPIELQNQFAARIEALDDLVTTTRSAGQHLDALFSSLQHRAFRGEL